MANDAYTSVVSIQPSASVINSPSQIVMPGVTSVNGQSNIYYERRKKAVKATK
jgi:hypothetical protein